MDPFAAKLHNVRWVDSSHTFTIFEPRHAIYLISRTEEDLIKTQLRATALGEAFLPDKVHVRAEHRPWQAPATGSESPPAGPEVWFQFNNWQARVGPVLGVDLDQPEQLLEKYRRQLAQHPDPNFAVRVLSCSGLQGPDQQPASPYCVLTIGDQAYTGTTCPPGSDPTWPCDGTHNLGSFHITTPLLDKLHVRVWHQAGGWQDPASDRLLAEVEIPLTHLFLLETKTATVPLADRLPHPGGELVRSVVGAKLTLVCRATAPPFPRKLQPAAEEPPIAAALAAHKTIVDGVDHSVLLDPYNPAAAVRTLRLARQAALEDDARQVFHVLDSGGKGYITALQFRDFSLSRGLASGDTITEYEHLCSSLGITGRDTITQEEFFKIMMREARS